MEEGGVGWDVSVGWGVEGQWWRGGVIGTNNNVPPPAASPFSYFPH